MCPVALRRADASDSARLLAYFSRLEEIEGTPVEFRLDADTLTRDWFGAYRAEAVFAEVEGRTVGFALCLPGLPSPDFPDALYAAAAFVEPAFRGNGVGRVFIDWFAQRAHALGRSRLLWCCFPHNRAACRFSERLGAVVCDEPSVPGLSGTVRRYTKQTF